MTSIMMTTLEKIRKNYKADEDIMHELTKTPEYVVDFDRTWNGTYSFVRCREFNGPMLGRRAEKCRKNGDCYDETLVKKYKGK